MKKFILISLLLCTACAVEPNIWDWSGGKGHFPNKEAAIEQLNADLAYCIAQANTGSGATPDIMGLAVFTNRRDMCMRGKGWVRR